MSYSHRHDDISRAFIFGLFQLYLNARAFRAHFRREPAGMTLDAAACGTRR